MYAQLPAVRVNNKSLFLDLLRVVVVDTAAGFPIEPELNDDVDDADAEEKSDEQSTEEDDSQQEAEEPAASE